MNKITKLSFRDSLNFKIPLAIFILIFTTALIINGIYYHEANKILLASENENLVNLISTITFKTLTFSLIFAAIAMVVGIFVIEKILYPITRMTKGVQNYLDSGKMLKLLTGNKNEIGLLSQDFLQMHHKIDKRSKQLEKSIKIATNALSKMQDILDHAAEAIITVNHKGEIQSFNKAAEDIFGYKEKKMINKNIDLLMSAAHLEMSDKEIIGVTREVTAKRKNGRRFPIKLSLSKVKTKGTPLFTALIRDITDRKKAEKQILEPV